MKNNKNKINQIISSVLVIGFIVCSFFFATLASKSSVVLGNVIRIAILVVFGLLLFYATRVGEGKAVKRFSLSVLLLVDLPALYIILASFVSWMPFNQELSFVAFNDGLALQQLFTPAVIVVSLAAVALGYGIPYTFLSGFEMVSETDEEGENVEEEETVLKGGLAEELLEAEKEDEASDETDDVKEEKEEAEETEESSEEAEDKPEKEAEEKDSEEDEKKSEE